MFEFLFKSKNEKIHNILNKSYKIINSHIFIRIDKLDFEFYVISEKEYDSLLLKNIEKYASDIFYVKSGVIISTTNGFIIISYKIESLEFLCKILEEKGRISKSQLNRLNYDVDKYLSTSYSSINNIKTEYPSTIITASGIIIIKPIIPSRFIWENGIGAIPEDDIRPINSLEFIINSENKILSIKLDNSHPNCDKHYNYCLGNLKFLDLNLESINSIIKSVEVYNLKSAYFIPTGIKKYLKEFHDVTLTEE